MEKEVLERKMIPLRDINPTRTFPLTTLLLIVANVLVFIYELILPSEEALQGFIYTMGAIPYEVVHSFGPRVAINLLTSIFLHAGFVHIIGNMLFLWIFGNNVEDNMGRLRFAAFYLLCGFGASATQIAVAPSSRVPIIGASGAIAGVLGAYLPLFPHAQIDTLLILGYFIRLVRLPAVLVIGLWVMLQFFSGLASLGIVQAGGVAWFAHIGGFIAGLLLVNIFRRRLQTLSPPYV